MKEKKDFIPASTISGGNISYGENGKTVFNIQFDNLKKAKDIYESKVKEVNEPKIEDMFEIVSKLGQSLTTLLGRGYTGQGHTPALRTFIDTTFPTDKGWNLRTEDEDLYDDFVEFDDFYKDFVKHPDDQKLSRLPELLDRERLDEFIRTTQKMWSWYLDNYYNGNIPEDIADAHNWVVSEFF